MIDKGQDGVLLLPVALTLAIIGSLAYAMTSEGSMNVSDVDAQYDIAVARYAAASGVAVAAWRAGKSSCDGTKADLGKLEVPDGSVTVTRTKLDKGFLTISTSASTNRNAGTVQTLTRRVQVFDLGIVKQATMIGAGDDDTTIDRTVSISQANLKTLEATDDTAHPLIAFKLPAELADKGSLVQADFKITKQSANSTQPDRAIGVHRVTRAWTKDATWTKAGADLWSTPGGDYAQPAVANVTIDPGNGAYNGAYTLRIDALVQGWADGSFPNYGLLLKPTRLLNALFVSFDGSTKPELSVRYFKRCT
jgi:hypothetical protein